MESKRHQRTLLPSILHQMHSMDIIRDEYNSRVITLDTLLLRHYVSYLRQGILSLADIRCPMEEVRLPLPGEVYVQLFNFSFLKTDALVQTAHNLPDCVCKG
jgi:hypothetical protein